MSARLILAVIAILLAVAVLAGITGDVDALKVLAVGVVLLGVAVLVP